MDDLRGSPLSVGTLEEMIDDNHAIISSSVGPEYYVNVMSFVNQDLLEPGSSVLLHNKVLLSMSLRVSCCVMYESTGEEIIESVPKKCPLRHIGG